VIKRCLDTESSQTNRAIPIAVKFHGRVPPAIYMGYRPCRAVRGLSVYLKDCNLLSGHLKLLDFSETCLLSILFLDNPYVTYTNVIIILPQSH